MRISALFIRIFQQMLRDKRTLALLLFAPLFVLTLMNFIFKGDATTPKVGIVDVQVEVSQYLNNTGLTTINFESGDKNTVIENDLDALLIGANDEYLLYLKNTDTSIPKIIQMKVNQAIVISKQTNQVDANKVQANQPEFNTSNLSMETTPITLSYVYGDSSTSLFDIISPMMIGLFIFFFVFLISGIGLLRERITGTLERLMSTPIKRFEVILGYLLGYGFFAVLQTTVIIIFSIKVLNINCAGAIGYVFLINFVCAIVALSLGILLSTFATSEFQMMQFIPLVIVPQIFFCGIFPLDGMAEWIKNLAYFMPLYYISDALSGVMYKAYDFGDIYLDLLVGLGFSIIFIILNIFALKKYRRL